MVLATLAVTYGPGLAAQTPVTPAARQYGVARASDAIRVDGILDERSWQEATPIPLPYETLPGDNAP